MTLFYTSPFEENTWYVTTGDIVGTIEEIPSGTELQYLSTAYSLYDGMIGFFFKDSEDTIRRWDIEIDQDPLKESDGKFRAK